MNRVVVLVGAGFFLLGSIVGGAAYFGGANILGLAEYSRVIEIASENDARQVFLAAQQYLHEQVVSDTNPPRYPSSFDEMINGGFLTAEDKTALCRFNTYSFSPVTDPAPGQQPLIVLVASYQTKAGGHTITWFSDGTSVVRQVEKAGLGLKTRH